MYSKPIHLAAKLPQALAVGLGLVSLALAPWGVAWVLVMGLLGGGLAWLGYRLEGHTQTTEAQSSHGSTGQSSGSGARPRIRARVTLRTPTSAPLSQSEVARMLAELRPAQTAVPSETPQPDPKLLRRYRRLQKSGMQPLFELEALSEVA